MSELDQIDLRILRCLQNNGRLSNVELSERVHLSAAQCWRRVRNLERNGVVTSYAALLNREKLGFGVLAFANISFDEAQHRKLAELLGAINDCPVTGIPTTCSRSSCRTQKRTKLS